MKMSLTNSTISLRTHFLQRLTIIRDAAIWTAVRAPSPVFVAMLSRAPAAIGGTVALLLLAILLLFSPSGILGVFTSVLAWVGGLTLGATAVRASLLTKQLVNLEERLRVCEMELSKRLSGDEMSVLRRARERTTGKN